MTPESDDFKQVKFNGLATEWFGIWIVNLLLSIITIGIYSAWAKVRKNKYFYGNTEFEGRTFDYHATGMQILIGRLIVIGVFIAISVVSGIWPPAIIIVYLALFALLPWLLIRSAMFNARNSSWSNVRFDFKGTYGDAFVTYILLPIGVALTLYTTFPFLTRRTNRFYIGGHSLGHNGFTMQAPIKPFYKAAILPVVWVVFVLVVFLLIGGATLLNLGGGEPDMENTVAMAIFPILALYGLIFIGILPASVIYFAKVRNVVYAHTVLEGGHRFASTTKALPLLGIVITNSLAIVFSGGLATPWTQVRMARYLAANTYIAPNGSIDDFVGKLHNDRSAIGDAFADIEGIDIGGAAI